MTIQSRACFSFEWTQLHRPMHGRNCIVMWDFAVWSNKIFIIEKYFTVTKSIQFLSVFYVAKILSFEIWSFILGEVLLFRLRPTGSVRSHPGIGRRRVNDDDWRNLHDYVCIRAWIYREKEIVGKKYGYREAEMDFRINMREILATFFLSLFFSSCWEASVNNLES